MPRAAPAVPGNLPRGLAPPNVVVALNAFDAMAVGGFVVRRQGPGQSQADGLSLGRAKRQPNLVLAAVDQRRGGDKRMRLVGR